jgi:uncharacterized protein
MVFKRRNKLSWGRWILEGLYPRSGWKRATSYIGHRLRRLPDTPDKIARGIGVGVYISFTPFFGMHFVSAALLAMLFRGNIIAAILGTFFGNPITFPFIATSSLSLGRWMLGVEDRAEGHKSILRMFGSATWDFWYNFKALFSPARSDWSHLKEFFTDVFFPYFVGGLLPGAAAALAMYFLSKPLIAAYQKRRKGRLLQRWKDRRGKKQGKTDSPG